MQNRRVYWFKEMLNLCCVFDRGSRGHCRRSRQDREVGLVSGAVVRAAQVDGDAGVCVLVPRRAHDQLRSGRRRRSAPWTPGQRAAHTPGPGTTRWQLLLCPIQRQTC